MKKFVVKNTGGGSVSVEEIRRILEEMRDEFQGKRGSKGKDGESAPATGVKIEGEYIFFYPSSNVTIPPTPTSIKLKANLYGDLSLYKWRYWNTTTEEWTDLSGTSTLDTYTLAYDNVAWGTKKTLAVRCYSDTYYDEIVITKIFSTAVPSGGTNGQVLCKRSDNDYETEWRTLEAGGVSETIRFFYGALDMVYSIFNFSFSTIYVIH